MNKSQACGIIDSEWENLEGMSKEEVIVYLIECGFSREVAQDAVKNFF